MKTLKSIIKSLSLLVCLSQIGFCSEGYFLNLKQKGELITYGKIEDANGTWYDIWVCPGYQDPALNGIEAFKQAGNNLKEYFEKEKYSKITDNSKEAFDWTFKDCLRDYTLKGSAKAWPKYFGQAHERAEKKLFGWWLGYPYAFMQATLESTWRLSTGLIGTAGGTVTGGVLIPAYYMTNSTFKAAWNGGAKGVLLPVSEMAWNTAVSPVLALFGEKPSKERVDGFWISVVEPPYSLKKSQADPLNEAGRIIRDTSK